MLILKVFFILGISFSAFASQSTYEAIQNDFDHAIDSRDFDKGFNLLSQGANINHLDGKRRLTLLRSAVKNGNIEAVKLLIEQGADVNLSASKDDCPFDAAVLSDNGEIVAFFMKTSFPARLRLDKIRTSVIRAINFGRINALAAIFDHRFSGNDYTPEGYSWLQFAASVGRLETVKFFIGRDLKFIMRDGKVSHVLHLLVWAARDNDPIDKIKFLLDYGANAYEHMVDSTYIMMKAKFPSYSDLLAQSDPAIVIAVFKNNYAIFKIFLGYGINPNTRIFNESRSLLHFVCELGKVQMAAYLISKGADIHSYDVNGKTPFDLNTREFANQVEMFYGHGDEMI